MTDRNEVYKHEFLAGATCRGGWPFPAASVASGGRAGALILSVRCVSIRRSPRAACAWGVPRQQEKRDVSDIQLFEIETLKSPHAAHKRLRDEAPVYFARELGVHVVTRYQLLREALRATRP